VISSILMHTSRINHVVSSPQIIKPHMYTSNRLGSLNPFVPVTSVQFTPKYLLHATPLIRTQAVSQHLAAADQLAQSLTDAKLGQSINLKSYFAITGVLANSHPELVLDSLDQTMGAQARLWRHLALHSSLKQLLVSIAHRKPNPSFVPAPLQVIFDDMVFFTSHAKATAWLTRTVMVLAAPRIYCDIPRPIDYRQLWVQLQHNEISQSWLAPTTPSQQLLDNAINELSQKSSQGVIHGLYLLLALRQQGGCLIQNEADFEVIRPLLSPKLLKGKHLQVCALMAVINSMIADNPQQQQGLKAIVTQLYGVDQLPVQGKALLSAFLQIPAYQTFNVHQLPSPPIFDKAHADLHWWAVKVIQTPLPVSSGLEPTNLLNRLINRKYKTAQQQTIQAVNQLLTNIQQQSVLQLRHKQLAGGLTDLQHQLWDNDLSCDLSLDLQQSHLAVAGDGSKHHKWRLISTCDPLEILEAATKTLKSCMSPYRDAQMHQYHLNRLISSGNRHLLIEHNDHFIGRSNLRMVTDQKNQPHLYFDRCYWADETNHSSHTIAQQVILSGLKNYAQLLGVGLAIEVNTAAELQDEQCSTELKKYTQLPLIAPDYFDCLDGPLSYTKIPQLKGFEVGLAVEN